MGHIGLMGHMGPMAPWRPMEQLYDPRRPMEELFGPHEPMVTIRTIIRTVATIWAPLYMLKYLYIRAGTCIETFHERVCKIYHRCIHCHSCLEGHPPVFFTSVPGTLPVQLALLFIMLLVDSFGIEGSTP